YVPSSADTPTLQGPNRTDAGQPGSLKGAFPRRERAAPPADNSQVKTREEPKGAFNADVMADTDKHQATPTAISNTEPERGQPVRSRSTSDMNTGVANEIWQGTSVSPTLKGDSKSGAARPVKSIPEQSKLRQIGEKSGPPWVLIALLIVVPLSVACI